MELKEFQNTEALQQMFDKLGAETVFGTPKTEGETVVIPVSQVEFGFGYGGGYGIGPDTVVIADDEDERQSEHNVSPEGEEGDGEQKHAEGGGGGGGGGGRITPRGYIHITPEGVKYKPIEDDTRIPLAGIAMVAWSVFWITLTIRAIAKMFASRPKIEKEQTELEETLG